MSEIIRVPFHGDELLTVEVDGKPHIVLKPALDAIGLDAKRQIDKLAGKSWARTALVPVRDSAGRQQLTNVADIRTFLMLLATIDERRVAEHVRPKLIDYQSEVADAIEAYWTRGRAVNPRAVDEPITYTWDEVTTIIRQRYGVVVSVPHLTRVLRTAGILRQTGVPKKAHQHFFWFTGTAWEIHPHAIPFLTRSFEDTTRQLQEFRFIQGRLELDGVGVDDPPRLVS